MKACFAHTRAVLPETHQLVPGHVRIPTFDHLGGSQRRCWIRNPAAGEEDTCAAGAAQNALKVATVLKVKTQFSPRPGEPIRQATTLAAYALLL